MTNRRIKLDFGLAVAFESQVQRVVWNNVDVQLHRWWIRR